MAVDEAKAPVNPSDLSAYNLDNYDEEDTKADGLWAQPHGRR